MKEYIERQSGSVSWGEFRGRGGGPGRIGVPEPGMSIPLRRGTGRSIGMRSGGGKRADRPKFTGTGQESNAPTNLSPGLAEERRLPWENVREMPVPQRGCVWQVMNWHLVQTQPRWDSQKWGLDPGVAPQTAQPRAGRRNPVGIGGTNDSEPAAARPSVPREGIVPMQD